MSNFIINFIGVVYFMVLVCDIHWTSSIWMYVYKISSVVYNSFHPLTIAYQAPLFMEFSRQEYWSGLPFPPPGDPPDPGIEPMSLMSPALATGVFTTSNTWEAHLNVSVQFSRSVVSNSLWPMNHSTPGPLSITNSQSPPKPLSIESVMPSSHLILCHPLLLLPPVPPSIRVFSNESTLLMRWPKYWSFSFSISPSSEHPGLISFRMDWLDLLAVQGTLKSLLQHHSSKASILGHSAFFTVVTKVGSDSAMYSNGFSV